MHANLHCPCHRVPWRFSFLSSFCSEAEPMLKLSLQQWKCVCLACMCWFALRRRINSSKAAMWGGAVCVFRHCCATGADDLRVISLGSFYHFVIMTVLGISEGVSLCACDYSSICLFSHFHTSVSAQSFPELQELLSEDTNNFLMKQCWEHERGLRLWAQEIFARTLAAEPRRLFAAALLSSAASAEMSAMCC